ncbi:MAG: sigma-E processing peptidase SpoIIGA [Clostridia bacterium]|nr:sigma-E processing peptidase SpoIIGA [Clostridia bacterium]
MQQEVYADLYILVNTGMDLLCLMITAALLHRKILRSRAIVGALFGGAYALLALLCGFGGLWGVILDVLAAFLMCMIVFAVKGESFLFLCKVTAVDVIASAFLGGVMTALYTWLNRMELPMEQLGEDGISVWMFAALATVSGFLTAKGGMFFGLSHKTKSLTLEAVLFGKRVTLRAMVDSGNLLRDPLSGRSVIAADRKTLEKILPKDFPKEGEMNTAHALAKKVRIIPTHTAVGSGMLTAIVPDSLTVIDRHGRHPCDYLIAPVSLKGKAEGFDALIPME